MMEIRRLSASAGAQWVFDALRLLKASPLGFGMLGALYAVLSLGTAVLAAASPDIAALLQLVSFVIAALLVAGMIYAAQEVDHGRGATLGALFASLGAGKGERMFKTLLAQAVFTLVLLGLTALLIGQENLEKAMVLMAEIQKQAQAGARIDPALLQQSPIARVVVGGLAVMALSAVLFLFTLTVLPDMLLAGQSLMSALRRGIAAALRNLPAMLLCAVLGFVLLMTVSIGFGVVLGIAQQVLGEAVAVLGTALLFGFFMCLIAGTMYFAWKDMLGERAAEDPSASDSGVAM
jgi:hypothetical protein